MLSLNNLKIKPTNGVKSQLMSPYIREILYSSSFFTSSKLDSYLTGLYEGDGHISINYKQAQFCITFNLKDLPLAEKLKTIIGHGFIRIKEKEKACVYIICSKEGLLKIVNLLNGNFRSPKVDKFFELIDFMNNKHNIELIKLPLTSKPLEEDSWLAGFIDADGGFKIRNDQKSINKKRRITCSLVIEQRKLDPITGKSYYKLLSEISTFFETSLVTRNQLKTGREYYNITATSIKYIQKVKSYLDKFPLYSSKYLD